MPTEQAVQAAPILAPADARPVDRPERITAIDSLRGFAVLGILLMNIVGMGMYGSAYDDPTVTGGATGASLWAWIVMHVLAEGKMRCLFSMVFGASVILLTERLADRRDAADIYYRRTLWLLLFGVAHAFLLWSGDVLYPYALCGLALYPFRNLRARTLLILGSIMLIGNSALYIKLGFDRSATIRDGRAAQTVQKTGGKLTAPQQEALTSYERWHNRHYPDAGALERRNRQWRGNPLQVIGTRAQSVIANQSQPYYGAESWDIFCMMFIGMALMKYGVLGAARSGRFYAIAALIGYGVGVPLNIATARIVIASNFDPAVQLFSMSTYDLGRLSVALGHLGLIMLFAKTQWMRGPLSALGAVGQMAFSNYIFQSVAAAFLFTGYGFRMYGILQRYELYYVVAAIWIVQLIVSPIWLRHYRFGPLEWCWRSLTYWKRQPMRLT
jgi:uncharacterized protein